MRVFIAAVVALVVVASRAAAQDNFVAGKAFLGRTDGAAEYSTNPENACREERLDVKLARASEDGDTAAATAKLAECEQRVAGRREEREGSARTRPLAEIEKIPRYYRLRVEQARIDEAEASKQRAAEARRTDPKMVRPAYSGAICALRMMREDTAADVAEELRYARIGGVVNKVAVYRLQERMRAIDAVIAEHRRSMSEQRLKPASCREKLVAAIAACLGPDHEDCDAVDDYVRLAPSMVVQVY